MFIQNCAIIAQKGRNSYMNIQKELEKYYKWHETALHFINHMLLYDRIMLEEIPQSMRIIDKSIYVTALRTGNGISCERFINTLRLLCIDICSLNKGDKQRMELIRLLSHYLYLNDHKEDECLVIFQKNICQEILHEMHQIEEYDAANIMQQLKSYGSM